MTRIIGCRPVECRVHRRLPVGASGGLRVGRLPAGPGRAAAAAVGSGRTVTTAADAAAPGSDRAASTVTLLAISHRPASAGHRAL